MEYTEYFIIWLECCLNQYMQNIVLDETLYDIKNSLAKHTIYTEKQLYQMAYQKIKNCQCNTEYFFYVGERLAQNEIQHFAIGFSFLPHYNTKYGYLYSKLHGINMPFPTIQILWEIYCCVVKQISYHHFLTQLFDTGYELLFEKQTENTVLSEQPLILKKELAYFMLTGALEQKYYSIQSTFHEKMIANKDIWQKIENISKQQHNICVMITGEEGSGKKFLAKQYAYQNHAMLLSCQAKKINQDNIFSIIIAGILYHAVICIENCQYISYDDWEEISLLLQKYRSFFPAIFLLCNQQWEGQNAIMYDYIFETATLKREERKLYWDYFLKTENGIDTQELANKYIMTQGQIKQAVMTANQKMIAEKCVLSQKLLESCCTFFNRKYLSQKAIKMKALFEWEQLILPQEQKELLKQVCYRVSCAHIVYDEWGYDSLLPYGRGVCMLFAGKSGTGKTMAAQVMGKELGLDVYKVDLSQIISKYIGETEKNINMIFDEAMKNNVILFFDEMEALFTKRTDVKNANDRYTNMEVAFLLQKMEQYDGVSILATNHLEQIDTAFYRRIQYVVSFPFPDAQQRYALWKSFITDKVPLEQDIDIEYLSNQFEMTGGSIKNAVLTALFLAAGQKQKCSMVHILKAIKQELQKQCKVILPCDFGKYENLF